jgi:hypothetical protein
MAQSKTFDIDSYNAYTLISASLQEQYKKFFQLNADGYVNIETTVVDGVVQDLSRETNRKLIDFRDQVIAAIPTLRGYIGRPITDPDVVAVTSKIDSLTAKSKSVFDFWVSGARLVANAADVNPFDKASGGIISYQGSYTYHTFYSSGSFTVFDGPLTDGSLFLVSGGGGGGGIDAGGGGGGGTTDSQTALTFTNGTYTVTVGRGGAGGTPTTPALPGESTVVTGGEGIYIIERDAIGGCNGSSGEGLASDLACGGGGSGFSDGGHFDGGTGLITNGGNALEGDGYGIGGGGGGGGKGGDGGNANSPSTSVVGGYGGSGVDSVGSIPYKSFRVCDGGGGGGVIGGAPQFPLGGGGTGGSLRANGTDALANSGSGGGGGGAAGAPLASGGTATTGGRGGSGFVVFAYSTPVG